MTQARVQELDHVVVRFAGDSGDGMQLTGDRFTSASGILGNDIATLPDFPAEIRAPAGTVHGVSAFQVHFSSEEVSTPGDRPNVLVAMNPAALKANLADLERRGIVMVNEDAFTATNLAKAGYVDNPLTDGSLDGYQVYEIPMTSLTLKAVEGAGVNQKEAQRCKNFFALGVSSWMFHRPTEPTEGWIAKKFASRPSLVEVNLRAFRTGYNFGETAELFASTYSVKPAHLKPGTYRNITGNQALALGLLTAAHQSKLEMFLASYPITPASDILHEVSRYKNFGVRTLQAEDEIAAVCAAIGASFGGGLGVTTTSGPGLDLKQEAIGLAGALELPLIVVDVQRAGPSTGMPTKTEQSDLLAALYGRHGESPLPVIAASSPGQCFWAALEAARIAIKYRTPVILLSDTYLANGAEPWIIPNIGDLPELHVDFATQSNAGEEFLPYLRDPKTLARPWAIPGTPALEHRIGGLEKDALTGNISYDPENHERMTQFRAAKVEAIGADIQEAALDADTDSQVLVVGWGSSWGAIWAAVRRVRARGEKVAWCHLTHLAPLPSNVAAIVTGYQTVIVPETNSGQLVKVLRDKYLVDARGFNKVRGLPFRAAEIEAVILDAIGELGSGR